jgi:glyoxylase-like metal-dependent hydrolase (beta-lactamase superfamily II)
MQQIIPGLYTFTGMMVGRVYLIQDDDGLTIIDASIPPSGKKILSQLQAAGHKPGDVKRILITHAHPDHVGALAMLKEATGAQIIAHELEKPIIQGEVEIPRADPATLPPLTRRLLPPSTRLKPIPVDQTVKDGDVLDGVMGGLHVVFTPGHAPGHVSYWQPEKRVVIMGDVIMRFFNNGKMRLPFAPFTVDMDEDKRSIKRVAALGAEVACFGHGNPITQDTAAQLNAFAASV